jgi:hypothetical protein
LDDPQEKQVSKGNAMGWLPAVIGAIASVIFYNLDEIIWLSISVVLTIAEFWSWGVMHNYAMDAAKGRSGFRGGFYDITPWEADSVPNWITLINLAVSIGCLAMLIVALIFIF